MPIQYPKPLFHNATIGLICPASGFTEHKKINIAVKYLNKLGFKVKLGKSLISSSKNFSYLSGPDKLRANDFNDFWNDNKIDAIFCLRGGYGCLRLLDDINFKLIKNKRKIFLGFSDITVLLLAIYKKSNLITFHGPMFGYKFLNNNLSLVDKSSEKSLWSVLFDPKFSFQYSNKLSGYTIRSGKAQGVLLGGNLTDISSMIGSTYLPDFKDSILLLEDCNEEPYKIDRMLTQLAVSGVFKSIKGIIFSSFYKCGFKNKKQLSVFLKEKFAGYKIPIVYGFSIGHEKRNLTVPIGKKVFFDADNLLLKSV